VAVPGEKGGSGGSKRVYYRFAAFLGRPEAGAADLEASESSVADRRGRTDKAVLKYGIYCSHT